MSTMPSSWCRCTSAAPLQSSGAAKAMRPSAKSPWPRSMKRRSARQCSPRAKRSRSRETRCRFVRCAACSTRTPRSGKCHSSPQALRRVLPPPPAGAVGAAGDPSPPRLCGAEGEATTAAAGPPEAPVLAPAGGEGPSSPAAASNQSWPGQQRRMKFTDLPVRRILRASSRLTKHGTISTSREYMEVHRSSRGTEPSAHTKNSPQGSCSSPSVIQARIMASRGFTTRRRTAAQAPRAGASPTREKPWTAEASAPPSRGPQASQRPARRRTRPSGARSRDHRRRRVSSGAPASGAASDPASSRTSSRE
mmetsp:Transcript_54778/g.170009  ORF Transcript_54778/g.170009 Transcript_54778/m.170009 type:complete len:307 (+) Transcript_54778:916-1836(+)